jgi:hypothetical protein
MSADPKVLQRRLAEKRRALASTPGKSQSAKKAMNAPEQRVHGEGPVHENTDRDVDTIYDTEGDNEVIEWRRYSDLEAPPPRPGYVNRFIRTSFGPMRDAANLRRRIREGWRPVKASSVPGQSLPTIHLDRVGDVIGVEDLILCEMPVRLHKQRQEHFRQRNMRMSASIDRQLKKTVDGSTPGFGSIQQLKQSSVSVRRRPTVQAQEDVED